MISTFSKALTNLSPFNFIKATTLLSNHSQSFSAAFPLIFHRLEIQSLSDKWHIDFSYSSCSLTQNDQFKIRPYSYGRVFSIKFVEKSMRFIKGRPQYKIQLLANQVFKLAYWSPQYGKYEMVRSTPYKQQVFFVEKIIKNHSDQAVEKFLDSIKKQNYPITLFRFNFYNNKIDGQKSKDFFLTPADMNLLQMTLRSSFGGLTFNDSKQEYQIWKLQRQIVKKQMAIFREQKKQKSK